MSYAAPGGPGHGLATGLSATRAPISERPAVLYRDGDTAGIVSNVYPDGHFDTVEGNGGNQVARVHRNANDGTYYFWTAIGAPRRAHTPPRCQLPRYFCPLWIRPSMYNSLATSVTRWRPPRVALRGTATLLPGAADPTQRARTDVPRRTIGCRIRAAARTTDQPRRHSRVLPS
jgi:hypothetical protein